MTSSHRRYSISVYGCQMNVYDGDRLRNAMDLLGWEEVDDPQIADCAIFITCSIRDKAEQKVLSDVGRLRASWQKGRRPVVAMIGCMAQRVGESIASRFPWIYVISGPRSIGAVPEAIVRAVRDGERSVMLDDDPRRVDDLTCAPVSRGNLHKAYVTIAHGCDQFCSYCIVPYVRGRFGSRPKDQVVREIGDLISRGVVEVTLLGQNVNTYGRDVGTTFASLLDEVAALDGLRRVRFVTSHPLDFSDDILQVMADRQNICRSINLPVQSGSDRILAAMNRKYTRAQYVETIDRIRSAFPDCGLTTDIIVGFPGETEKDFDDTMSLLREIRFDLVHSAAYSPREGTPAAVMQDQIDDEVKSERLNVLNAAQAEIALSINSAQVGKKFEVLFDEPALRGEGMLQGRTDGDKVVLVKCEPEMIGRFAEVEITSASQWCLEGKIE